MTWSSFWDSFKAAVHDNDSIPKIDKFNYLNSSLEGLAARTVQGLTLTEGNFDSAVELLKERFGKPQQIISVHMDKLLRIPTCTSDRLSSLREVYGKITVNVRGLSALGVGVEQYGSLLIPIIMAKLPNNVKLRIAGETQEDVWKIEDLLKAIKLEVEARETSDGVKAQTMKSTGLHGQNFPPANNQNSPTASALVASDVKVKCVYCERTISLPHVQRLLVHQSARVSY